jgi:hypothetical protein
MELVEAVVAEVVTVILVEEAVEMQAAPVDRVEAV